MHKVALCLLTLTTALLAGCAEDAPDSTPVVTPEVQYEDEVVSVTLDTMPRDPPAAGERTLDSVPRWRLGEWWTYTMTDGFTGGTYEFTRVVGGEDRQAGNYLVGFPADAFSNDVMLFHIPGFGDIRQTDLSYETHDAVFQPLDFPLTAGKTWEVSFEGVANGMAEVTAAQGTKATITMDVSVYGTIVAEYDADVGEITKMTIGQDGSYAVYEVTGHGYDYQGLVRVPHAHDLVFNHGRFAGAVAIGGDPDVPLPGVGGASQPTETVNVPAGYDRLSFIIAVGGGGTFLGAATAGVFQETVTAPDGQQYQAQWTPADAAAGRDLVIIAIGHDKPEGDWTMQHVAAGTGVAFVEGIGYHSIDIDLPSGCVVASFNAQHHNADCKVTYAQTGNATMSMSMTGTMGA